MPPEIAGAPSSPPAFSWEKWYAGVGGRTIRIDAVDDYLRQIRQDQEPRFCGSVAATRRDLGSPESAAQHLKEMATQLGADIVDEVQDRGEGIVGASAVVLAVVAVWGRRVLMPVTA